MRIFINFFLIGFALDGLASTIDDFSFLLYDRHILEPVRNWLGYSIFLLSLPVYAVLGIDSRLPKRLLLPLILFVIWAGFGCLPLSIYAEDIRQWMPYLSLLQLMLGAFAFSFVKTTTGRWLLPAEFFARPAWRLKHTALFVLGNIFLLPVVAALLLASSAYAYLDYKTAGFMRLGISGVQLRERSYTREGKTIRLVAMVHIGSADYYREMGELLNNGKTLVLMEGVTDTQGLMKSSLSYSKIADFIGLDSQEQMDIEGRVLEYEDLEAGNDDGAAEPAIVRADIDSREFSEDARRYIETVGAMLNTEGSKLKGFGTYMKWYEENMTPEKEKAIFLEIIDHRNEALLRYLDLALTGNTGYDNIVIPWGAMHMPGLERAILQRGFVTAESKTRLAVDFSNLFANKPEEAAPAATEQ